MKKIVMAVMAIFAYAFIADSAMAATATGNLVVSTSVDNTCRVNSQTAVTFGVYDPTDPVANITGSGGFDFRCVKGTPFQLHIARTNLMTCTTSATCGVETLPYLLYSDAGRTAVWATVAAADPGAASPAVSNALIARLANGTIPALANVSAGSFAETVTVTVTY